MVGSVWRVVGAWADVVSSKVSRRAIEVHPLRLLVRVQKRFRMAVEKGAEGSEGSGIVVRVGKGGQS